MDRIERHDIINALGLAAVLLLMAFLLSLFAGRLFSTVGDGDGFITAEKEDDSAVIVTSTSSTTVPDEEPVVEEVVLRTPAEVKVLVVNAARVSGIASQGSDLLMPLGYQMLKPSNGNSVAESVVFYLEGYEADAAAVAVVLNMGETAIAPLPESVSFSPGDAHLIAVLGTNQTLR